MANLLRGPDDLEGESFSLADAIGGAISSVPLAPALHTLASGRIGRRLLREFNAQDARIAVAENVPFVGIVLPPDQTADGKPLALFSADRLDWQKDAGVFFVAHEFAHLSQLRQGLAVGPASSGGRNRETLAQTVICERVADIVALHAVRGRMSDDLAQHIGAIPALDNLQRRLFSDDKGKKDVPASLLQPEGFSKRDLLYYLGSFDAALTRNFNLASLGDCTDFASAQMKLVRTLTAQPA